MNNTVTPKFESYANYLIGAGVPNDKVDDCMEWAFGKGWQYTELGFLKDRWNKKYNNLFRIDNSMRIDETLFKIGKLFQAVELTRGPHEN